MKFQSDSYAYSPLKYSMSTIFYSKRHHLLKRCLYRRI
nr:MAG TPA: hypothetical protein [Caudoviricetes sp.]